MFASAQIVSILHGFSWSGSDGEDPAAGAIVAGNTVFGTTEAGGTNGAGTVFKVNIDGSGYTILHDFDATNANSTGVQTNNDGSLPRGTLALAGDSLFGTAYDGGEFGYGTVFTLKTNGSAFSTLHAFDSTDGSWPIAGLLMANGVLYGATDWGGSDIS